VETAQAPLFFPTFGADSESDVVAPYVVDQITFSEKFQLLLGARYDRIDFADKVTGISREDDQLSPMLGLVVLPSERFSIYASYGESFAPQSTFVVGQGQNRAPEESQQVEFGGKQELWGGDGYLSLALYQIERENIAIPDDATGFLAQTGDQRSRGLEIEFTAEPRKGLRTLLSYAYTDSELTEFREAVQVGLNQFLIFDRSGNAPAYTPEHLLNFWISQKFRGGWGLGGGGRYVGEQFIDEDNAFELEDYVVFDATVFYDQGPWRVSVNLKNLTDEEYFTRASQGNSVIPVAGFAAYTAFKYRFGGRSSKSGS
jgi:outer membrane receptor protein involved in Fe transport